MAIFHLNYRGCSPATGAGAVRKAAYQSGQALVEERTGQLCDYARKERVVEEGLSLPGGVPPIGRGELWNVAERAWAEGGGGNELVALRYEFALPIELDAPTAAAPACATSAGCSPRRRATGRYMMTAAAGTPTLTSSSPRSTLALRASSRGPRPRRGSAGICARMHMGSRHPIRATDWKAAKADGWEKIYNFKDGRRLTMKQAKAEGLGTKDRTSKRPVQMHRISGQAARDVGSAELMAVRAAWAEIANRHLAAHAAATGTTAQVIDHRSNKDRGLDEQPTVHEGGTGLIGHADRVKLNKEIRDRNARLRVLRAELQQEGAALEQLQREVAELERQRGRIEKAKRGRAQGRHRGALASAAAWPWPPAAAAADAQRRVAMATADQVDTRAEMIAQLDEQIAALDLKIRQLQGGNSAAMLSGPLLKAAGLGIERRKLADERARLAGEDPAPRKPEPPQAEQKRPRGHKH